MHAWCSCCLCWADSWMLHHDCLGKAKIGKLVKECVQRTLAQQFLERSMSWLTDRDACSFTAHRPAWSSYAAGEGKVLRASNLGKLSRPSDEAHCGWDSYSKSSSADLPKRNGNRLHHLTPTARYIAKQALAVEIKNLENTDVCLPHPAS